MTNKYLYNMKFNLYGQVFQFYRYAASAANAKYLALKELEKLTNKSMRSLAQIFDGSKDNYSICLEVKKK